MKFVCDNCKAKYQIGDDKVAGKTVRMKCRKCGYNIKVSPAGIEIADGPSIDMPSHDFEAPASLAAAVPHAPQSGPVAVPPARPAVALAEPPASPAGAPRSTWGDHEEESTSIMTAPVRDAVAAATGRPSSAAVPLRAPPAPRPVTPAPARPVTAAPTPRPFAAPRPVGAAAVGARPNDAGLAARAVSRPSSASSAAVQQEHTPRAAPPVALHAAPLTPAPAAPEHEWYVGIGGSPIGPVRLSVIRERAAANEVDGESLVWREGLSEWRPLRTIPELLEVINSVNSVAMGGAQGPPVAMGGAQGTPQTPLAASVAPVVSVPVVAAPAPVVSGLQPSVPVQVAGPFVPAASSSIAAVAPAVAVDAVASQVAAVASPASAPKVHVDIDPALEASLIPRQRGPHPVWALIAAATVFGGVAAYVLVSRPPPATQIVLVPGAAPSGVPAAVAKVADKGEAQVEVGELTTAPGGQAARVGGPRPKATATTTAAAASPLDTSGFVSNVPGPAAVAPGGPAPGGGQLSQGEMSGVVAQNQPRVRRKCWQPALDGAAANAPKSARVMVQISIAPGGNVESASASGAERDFPGLASCIGGMVRGWKFPASGGSTQVNVPFMFAGQ